MILESAPNLAFSLTCNALFVGAAEIKIVFNADRSYLATTAESASCTAIEGTMCVESGTASLVTKAA